LPFDIRRLSIFAVLSHLPHSQSIFDLFRGRRHSQKKFATPRQSLATAPKIDPHGTIFGNENGPLVCPSIAHEQTNPKEMLLVRGDKDWLPSMPFKKFCYLPQEFPSETWL